MNEPIKPEHLEAARMLLNKNAGGYSRHLLDAIAQSYAALEARVRREERAADDGVRGTSMTNQEQVAPEHVWISSNREHVHLQQQSNCLCGASEYIHFEEAARQLEEVVAVTWDKAITTLHQMKSDYQSIYHHEEGVDLCLAAIVRLEAARQQERD